MFVVPFWKMIGRVVAATTAVMLTASVFLEAERQREERRGKS